MKHFSSSVLKLAAAAATTALFLGTGATAAFASGSISVQSISPGTTVTAGSPVTFSIVATGFSNPSYSLSDSFVGGGLGSYNINSSGNFSWTPEPNDVGTHNVEIIVQDNDGDAATTNETFTVVNAGTPTTSTPAASPTLSIQSVEPSSIVSTGQTVSFVAVPTGLSGTPTYALNDSFSGSSINSSYINSSGDFSWTPTTNDAGTHVITVMATDSTGTTAQNSLSLTVEAAAVTAPITTTTVTATPAFTEDLATGSSDSEVAALQQLLTAQGDFTGSVTGYFGSLTEAAVEKFQADNNIPQLGIIGPATRAALNALVSAAPVTTTTSATTPATTTTVAGPTITQIKSEIQSIETQITQIETQLSALVGQ